MSSATSKHGREIFVPRMLSAIVWSILLQCLYVWCVLFLMNTDFLHPVQWIRNAYSSITNVGTWFYLLPLGVMTFAQGVLMSKDFMLEDPCIRTRFGTFCSALRPRCLLIGALNMVFGAMIVSYYSALLGDDTNILTRSCSSVRGKCLNERNFYLIANGIWIGLFSSIKRQVWEVRVLVFPITQQLKYPQVKTKLGLLVIQSFKEAILPSVFFSVLYWWCGGYLREHLSGFLGVSADGDSTISFLFWMNPFLLARCLLFSAIILLTKRTVEMLFQVFLTERYRFPISETVENQITLNEVLASPLPLMQRLGYLDLLDIAERDPLRQGELFSLSLPGGHPHNWNGVVSEVLKALDALTSGLNVAVADINRASNGPLLPSSPAKVVVKPDFGITRISSPQTSPTQLRLRNMSIIQGPNQSNSVVASSPMRYATTNCPSRPKDFDFMATIKQQISNVLQWIRRKPGINLLFGEMEDAHARHLLLHSQHLSWGAQALAHLAAASLKRDTYGVVQKDLPAIIKTLIQLKNVLERLPLQYHKRASRPGSLDLRMKAALSSAVKRSLYIMCCTFGQYLTDLSLSEDLKQILVNYVAFKEG